MPTTPETAHLIVVAGPSGAGKTVFIDQFRSGSLPGGIARHMPADAERWPQIGANDCMKRGVPLAKVLPSDWQAPGGVVHYDTAYIHRFGLAGYDDDPGAAIFRRAKALTVICVSPPPEMLKAQFEERLGRHRERKKASHLFWKDHVRRPLERLMGRLKGVDPRDTADVYRDPELLARCYEGWQAYARGLVAAKPGSRLIVLAPDTGASAPAFRVVSAG